MLVCILTIYMYAWIKFVNENTDHEIFSTISLEV